MAPAGGVAAERGAVAYAMFASVSDDNPEGVLLCILDGDGDCVTEDMPSPLAASYSRISLLAITASTDLPRAGRGLRPPRDDPAPSTPPPGAG